MNNSSGMLISIPSVLCDYDGLSRHIATSYCLWVKRMAEGKECRHLESCLTEYPIISVESMTSLLFFSITLSNNNLHPLSGENLVNEISFGKKMSHERIIFTPLTSNLNCRKAPQHIFVWACVTVSLPRCNELFHIHIVPLSMHNLPVLWPHSYCLSLSLSLRVCSLLVKAIKLC